MGGAAAGQARARSPRPPESGVDEQRLGLADQEFGIGRDMADFESQLTVEKLLLDLQFVEAHRGITSSSLTTARSLTAARVSPTPFL